MKLNISEHARIRLRQQHGLRVTLPYLLVYDAEFISNGVGGDDESIVYCDVRIFGRDVRCVVDMRTGTLITVLPPLRKRRKSKPKKKAGRKWPRRQTSLKKASRGVERRRAIKESN